MSFFKLIRRICLYLLVAYGGAVLSSIGLILIVSIIYNMENISQRLETYRYIIGIIGACFGLVILYRKESKFKARQLAKQKRYLEMSKDYGINPKKY